MRKKLPFITLLFTLLLTTILPLIFSCHREQPQSIVTELKLDHYRPHSIYHIPETRVEKPAFPVIDMHSHDYAESAAELEQWAGTTEELGIEKTVILTGQTGEGFDSLVAKYGAYTDRFELWCGIDFTGYEAGEEWVEHAVGEIERCHALGAKGIGEMTDKGLGILNSKPARAYGLHFDDPVLQPIWQKCAQLGMPVNVHLADPMWMYEPMDSTNDGLMNAYHWKIDLTREGILDHGELMQTLENLIRDNPGTTFIACHFANCSYDLEILGRLLDAYPNLWADISARYAETATIPRYMASFYNQYQDRLLYGTDMGMDEEMYRVTFRILETLDEHFYETEMFGYHWALNGFGLPKGVLSKLYRENALHLYEL
jgi:predicted TIM-barrel fold metal-dependent hydrolase